jgi:hypothetical protein
MTSSEFLVYLLLFVSPIFIARSRGKRWPLWILPSLVFGPLVLPFLFMGSKKNPNETPVIQIASNPQQTPILQHPAIAELPVSHLQSLPIPPEYNENWGFVYFITNPVLPQNWVKIGYTSRQIHERMEELDQAGLPYEYVLRLWIESPDAKLLERQFHRELAEFRLRQDKEFFEITIEQLQHLILSKGYVRN